MYLGVRRGVGAGVGAIRETGLNGASFPLLKGFVHFFAGVFLVVLVNVWREVEDEGGGGRVVEVD